MSCYFFIALLFLLHQLSSGACLCSCQKRWDNVTLWHLLVWCISGALKWSPRSEKKILSRGKEERNYCVGGSSKAICDYRGNEPSLTWSFVLYFLSTHTQKKAYFANMTGALRAKLGFTHTSLPANKVPSDKPWDICDSPWAFIVLLMSRGQFLHGT